MAKYLPEIKEYELIIPWNEAITIKLYSKEQIYKQELRYPLPPLSPILFNIEII